MSTSFCTDSVVVGEQRLLHFHTMLTFHFPKNGNKTFSFK